MNWKATRECRAMTTRSIVIMNLNTTARPGIVLADNRTSKRTSTSVNNVCYKISNQQLYILQLYGGQLTFRG